MKNINEEILEIFNHSLHMGVTIGSIIQQPLYPKKAILEKLVCHALDITKEQLFMNIDTSIPEEKHTRIHQAYMQYTVEKKPLEYILGWVEFLGNRFHVGPTTLIPRPETEYMIEAINEYIKQKLIKQSSPPDKGDTGAEGSGGGFSKINTSEIQKFNLLDIGTGCGVLGLSVLLHNIGSIKKAILTDLSADALHIAKKNHQTYKQTLGDDVAITFLEASLLDHQGIKEVLQSSSPTILVANLPYIPEQLFEDNTDDMVKKWEPKMAFVGGDDGLDLYRVMFDQLLDSGGAPVMFLEMMTRQVDILRKEYEKTFSFEEVKTFHFNIRIVKAHLI